VSGCFNSCGQHHIADLGFYGVSRKSGSHTVPHFQVVLGGQWSENAGSYGLPIGAIPSKRVPQFISSITVKFKNERSDGETFQEFIKRTGKANIKKILDTFTAIPTHSQDSGFYSDWGDPREFTIGDMGVGECAGEVVSQVEFELTGAEREVFEAQIAIDEENDPAKAGARAYEAMLRAARALILTAAPYFPNDPDKIIAEFKSRFFDTEIFFDQYAGGKFARYLFQASEETDMTNTPAKAHQKIGEAQLFVEAAYACYLRLHSAKSV
jgi:sulfite reductase (ferredoxin)